MSAAEWDATSWHDQRAYLDGLEEDETVPLSFEGGTGELPTGTDGPTIRENVDAGVKVIDLTAMRKDLEAARAARGGGPPV